MTINLKEIIKQFLTEKDISAETVSEIIDSLERDGGFAWRALGDSSNNKPRVNITHDKDHTLVERVTNSIDACIEKKALGKPEIKEKKDIMEVTQFLEDNDLWNEKEEVSVEIFPLKEKKKTNFLFIDRGIGVENEKMPYSILYFNSRSKTDKNYLRGSFGQGGSTVCRYSEYTVILTNSEGKTSFTIIRDSKKKKIYEYLVDKSNPDKFYAPTAYQDQPEKNYLPPYVEGLDSSGTSIIHVSYDFYKSSFVDYYTVFEENLFNSYLPYRLHYLLAEKNESRPMHGLKNRLEKRVRGGEVEKRSSTTFDLEDSQKAKIVYYYQKKEVKKGYLSDQRYCIFVTHNGQTHARLRRSLISDANLSKLTDRLIIEINCNQLSDDLKDKIFDSSRQKLDREYEQILEKSVVEFLSTDEFLREEQSRLEEEERKKR